MSDKKPAMRVRDDANVKEVYASKVVGTLFDGANLIVTLGSARSTPEKIGEGAERPSAPMIYVTERLVLSPSAAVELHGGISAMLNVLSRPADPKKAN